MATLVLACLHGAGAGGPAVGCGVRSPIVSAGGLPHGAVQGESDHRDHGMPEALMLEQRRNWGQMAAVFVAGLAIALPLLAADRIWPFAVAAAALLIPALLIKPVWGLYPLLVIITVIPPQGMVGILDYVLMPVDLYMMLRSEEHTSELQSRLHLVCRLLLEKKKKTA